MKKKLLYTLLQFLVIAVAKVKKKKNLEKQRKIELKAYSIKQRKKKCLFF